MNKNGASAWTPRFVWLQRRLLRVVEGVRDVVVGADGRRGAVTGAGDYLARRVDADLARGEDAGNVGLHPLVGDDVTAGVHVQQTGQEGRVRRVADEDEHR